MVNFSIIEGLRMPIKYFVLSLMLFLIYSCADNTTGSSATSISGQWDSDQYIYSPNCGDQQLSFDDYIAYLVTGTQQDDAQEYVDGQCLLYGQDWCDDNAEATYASQLDYQIYLWATQDSLTTNIIAENTIITDVIDIELNINPDNTYTISWEGVCIDYPEFTEDECGDLSAGTWSDPSCQFLTEEGCESSFVNGTWDNGSSGVLDENSDNYVMDDVDDESIFEGTQLIFDGSSISITVISLPELCVSLNFTK
jgi:hypothetical protein